MTARFVLAATVWLVAAPGSALAQQTLAPPGKAGADQYFETIPSSAGNAKPPLGSHSSGGGGGGGIPPGTLRALSHSKDGSAAAAFAAGTAPPSARLTGGAGTSRGAAPSSTAIRPLGGSDAGGLGIALPILIATVALVMTAAALALRRGAREAT